jgi:hypothetical protein
MSTWDRQEILKVERCVIYGGGEVRWGGGGGREVMGRAGGGDKG